MEPADICFLPIAVASQLIARKELSPVDVLNAHLERIEQTDGKLNSFITLMRDESIKTAQLLGREVQAGNYRGPLHGIPLGLKDLYYTKGVRTTVGSKILRDFVPDTDAAVTERFKEAGAIIIGKLQMHEFALGSTSLNPHDGPAHNPWDIERITGGSSGGSGSAVASGQCMGALGSDTGGSVRIPASLCGIVGLKPTFGRVSRYGVYPLSWSLDTVGPMTRTVHDAALILNAISGHDPRDPSSSDRPVEDYTSGLDKGIGGVRVGVPKEYFFDEVDPEVGDAVLQSAKVLEGLGASVEEVEIPVLEHALAIASTISITEAAEVHMHHLRHNAADMGPDVRSRLEAAALTPATDYIKAQRARSFFNQGIAEALEKFEVLLTPTLPISAPRIDEVELQVDKLPRLTRPFNISGLPAISVPCGFTSSGMPIGLQLAGRAFDEATLLGVAHAYERATDWHTRRPPVG